MEVSNVSFDFDDTLKTALGNPNDEIVAKFQQHMENDDHIVIVTSRLDSAKSQKEIKTFLQQNGLTAEGIFHTNGEFKAPTLDELEIDVHYDDDEEELKQLSSHVQGVNAFTDQAKADWDEYMNQL